MCVDIIRVPKFQHPLSRYSFTVSPPEVQYGNDPLIIPPFNWGDKPDRAYTSDGGELG